MTNGLFYDFIKETPIVYKLKIVSRVDVHTFPWLKCAYAFHKITSCSRLYWKIIFYGSLSWI